MLDPIGKKEMLSFLISWMEVIGGTARYYSPWLVRDPIDIPLESVSRVLASMIGKRVVEG